MPLCARRRILSRRCAGLSLRLRLAMLDPSPRAEVFSGRTQNNQRAKFQDQQETLSRSPPIRAAKRLLDTNDLRWHSASPERISTAITSWATILRTKPRTALPQDSVKSPPAFQAKLDFPAGYYAQKDWGSSTPLIGAPARRGAGRGRSGQRGSDRASKSIPSASPKIAICPSRSRFRLRIALAKKKGGRGYGAGLHRPSSRLEGQMVGGVRDTFRSNHRESRHSCKRQLHYDAA